MGYFKFPKEIFRFFRYFFGVFTEMAQCNDSHTLHCACMGHLSNLQGRCTNRPRSMQILPDNDVRNTLAISCPRFEKARNQPPAAPRGMPKLRSKNVTSGERQRLSPSFISHARESNQRAHFRSHCVAAHKKVGMRRREAAADAHSSGGIVMRSAQMWQCEYYIAALCAFADGIVLKRKSASSDLKFLIPNS